MNKEEIERRLIEGIRDNYTLNLAISILEDLDLANKKFEMIKNKIRDMQKRFNQDNYKGVSYDDDLEFDDILSIIGGE